MLRFTGGIVVRPRIGERATFEGFSEIRHLRGSLRLLALMVSSDSRRTHALACLSRSQFAAQFLSQFQRTPNSHQRNQPRTLQRLSFKVLSSKSKAKYLQVGTRCE